MDSIIELLDFDALYKMIESMFGFGESLVAFFSNTFGWLGPDVAIAIGVGITAAVILRILGR